MWTWETWPLGQGLTPMVVSVCWCVVWFACWQVKRHERRWQHAEGGCAGEETTRARPAVRLLQQLVADWSRSSSERSRGVPTKAEKCRQLARKSLQWCHQTLWPTPARLRMMKLSTCSFILFLSSPPPPFVSVLSSLLLCPEKFALKEARMSPTAQNKCSLWNSLYRCCFFCSELKFLIHRCLRSVKVSLPS